MEPGLIGLGRMGTSLADKMHSAMRFQFAGPVEKAADSSGAIR
jgi:prephenate dehydrogenase